jgi:membrane fusion protein (multidrug efflux system)
MSKMESQVIEAALAQVEVAQVDARNRARRKRAFIVLGVVVATCAIGYSAYQYLYASHFVSTDNAYTAAETAQVTPAISGIVREVRVADTQAVKRGDIVVVLDDTDRANLLAAQASADQSYANHRAALGSREANAVLIANATEDTNPEVGLARARLDQAKVNLERSVIRAPVDGVIARRTVQIGQQVQAGVSLLSVVPVSEVHVDANFKEVQLDRVKIGQPVKVTSDLYGRAVTYRGTVAGLSGGTGSAFATIPAQNATGNWIKVVQRVPVRIQLDPAELAARPLQVGLSMNATIDTRSVIR